MNLLSRIRKGSRSAFTASDEFEIWRLLFNNTGLLLIEERNRSKKEVRFGIISIGAKKEICHRWSPEEGFWTGIEAFHDEIILYHGYEKPDMPGHKGLIARTYTNNRFLWQLNDVRFLFCFEGSVYCSTEKSGKRNYFSVSLSSGELVRSFEDNAAPVMQIRDRYIQVAFKDFIYPEMVNEQIKTLLIAKGISFPEIRSETPAEYIVFKNKVILAYYKNSSERFFTQLLQVYDITDATSPQQFILHNSVERFVADSFFLYSSDLYMIAEKKHLYILNQD